MRSFVSVDWREAPPEESGIVNTRFLCISVCCLMLVTGLFGCGSRQRGPAFEQSNLIPSFGVPDQWEPEIAEQQPELATEPEAVEGDKLE